MVSLIAPIEEKFKERLDIFPWVNWSEVARENMLKKEIFEEYMKSRKLSSVDQEFCDKIDWHPVDELPMKKEYIEKLKKISREPSKGKAMSPEELKIWLDEL